MDSISQAALGSAVVLATMGRHTAAWKAALWGAVAGTLPDLDALIDHGDALLNMVLHRAESHSLFYLALLSAPLGWLVARLHGEQEHWPRWWLALAPIDLRCGMDRLLVLVQTQFGRDGFDGAAYDRDWPGRAAKTMW